MDENNVVEEMDETEEQEEEVLTCPVCGEEVEPGTENCPLCGAPVGTLENNTISGTAIDNSAAIDAMLQSAAMLVEESASLGVSLDDDEDDGGGEDTEQEEEEGEEGEEGEGDDSDEPDPMEPANITAMPSDLTDEQKSQIEAGGMINLNAGAPEPAPKKPPKKPAPKKKKKEPAEAPVLYNMDEKGNPIPDDDMEEAPYVPPVKKEPKPKKKGGSASPVLVIAVAVVALALGCAAGFFGKLMLFPDVALPECQEFAERAVKGVNSVTDEELYITEAYVKESGDSTQCVFRAFADGGDTIEACWYRVKVYNDAPDTVRIYFQLDMDAYQAMMNSDDGEQRIQASMLMNNQQELERCITEIGNGTGGWSAANAAMLNDTLRPVTE